MFLHSLSNIYFTQENDGVTLNIANVMQLFTIFLRSAAMLLISCLLLSAEGYSEKITLSVKNAPLEKVFEKIKQQSGYYFWYTNDILEGATTVDVEVRNATINETMDACLKGLPLSYQIVEKLVVIKRKRSALEENSFAVLSTDTTTINGQVLNEKKDPVPGATVTVKGGKRGAVTSETGAFSIANVAPDATLVISCIGYETQEIKAMGRSGFVITLRTQIGALDETLVIAYGTSTKRLLTGNISRVTAEEIQKQPVNNPLLALEGRVPGLFITQNNGVPGGGVTVRIQGQNSINIDRSGNDPLYIIDGVPYVSQMLSTTTGGSLGLGILGKSGGTVSAGGGNPLSYINPADIESVEVLKDADATAIYGSRAANGAILITTKKGKEGPARVEANVQHGWGRVTRKLDVLNTAGYLEMRREAFKNDNAVIGPTDYDLNGLWDTTRNTDWQEELIGGTSQYTDISVSVSGGSANTQYLIGSTYHRETTVFPGDFSDRKGSVHFSINSTPVNRKFGFQLSGSYMIGNNRLPGTDLTEKALWLAPNAPAISNPDGTLNWALTPENTSSWDNPLSQLVRTYQNRTNNLVSNATLSYRLLPNLEIKSSFGYTNLQTNETESIPLISWPPELQAFLGSSLRYAFFTNSNINSWIVEPQASYTQAIGKSKLNILVGTTIQQRNSNGQLLFANGFNSDLVLKDIRAASSIMVTSTDAIVYKNNALFGRLNYNWGDRYILNLTARRDGSSRFGAENQFHNFGAVGAAWIFSQHDFIQQNLSFLSYGKLRGSYGITGNDQIPDYLFMNLFLPTGAGVPYQGEQGLESIRLSNRYLEWEETKKLQVGIELGFLKDRILFTTNYVRNRSSNQLLDYPLPSLTGFGTITSNFPAIVQNTAWEFQLSTTNVSSTAFNWKSSLNLTIPKNKLAEFPDIASSTYADLLVVGQPISIQKAYRFMGVDPATGVYQFADNQGKPTFTPDPLADRTVLINTLPKFYGGFQNSIGYKGFQADFLFQFVKQRAWGNYLFRTIPGAFVGGINNQPVAVLNRWQKPGDRTVIQRFSQDESLSDAASYFGNSDYASSDASFIRLKNVSLSYEIPEKWRQKARLQHCRIYAQGQNLLTITDFPGLDPESQSSAALPVLRVWTIGVQIGL
jgi:TonB-linked SusC/RagA family outer membrane protein